MIAQTRQTDIVNDRRTAELQRKMLNFEFNTDYIHS